MYIFLIYRLPGMNITAKEFGKRFRKALSIPFQLNQACSANITEFVSAHAAALGCSEKTFFYPLLTCVSACMGTECYTEISNLWQEPPIIWTLVITPKSLLRIDVAEYLKQELLKVQSEIWLTEVQEDTKDGFKKFIFDMCTLEQLQDMLKLNNGHGFGIYNSIRSLHKCMIAPEETDVMQRLHNGLSLFKDSRVKRITLNKTRVNFSVISTPSVVQQTLNSAPNFQELFYQCFLTACAEENHVKFNQLSAEPQPEKLREIFHSLIKLHFSGPIVYRLSAEAVEKFGQFHDELSEKAKQMARKNLEYSLVFQPALIYLVRLSCVLHVLDNVLESINYKVPISYLTWNTEISAATVSHAHELLNHITDQRRALMEQITTDFATTPRSPAPTINVDGQQSPRFRGQRTPQANQVR